MKIALVNGKLEIDDVEVLTVVFKDGKSMTFPIDSAETLIVSENGTSSTSTAIGKGNVAVSGKNIVYGNIISSKGDFRIGDG